MPNMPPPAFLTGPPCLYPFQGFLDITPPIEGGTIFPATLRPPPAFLPYFLAVESAAAIACDFLCPARIISEMFDEITVLLAPGCRGMCPSIPIFDVVL